MSSLSRMRLPAGSAWDIWWVAGGMAATCLVVVGGIVAPKYTGAAAVGALAVWLMTKPIGRLLVFAGGSLALFQSSVFTSTARAAFVALLIAGLIPSLNSIGTASRTSGLRVGQYRMPILGIAALFALSIPFLATSAVDITTWFRDATTYLLLFVGAIYGVDAGLRTKSSHMRKLFAIIGMIGAFAFLVAWLDRRGVPLGGLGQFALSSSMIVVPVISMCLALYFGGSRVARGAWAAIAMLQISMLVGSGGRSGVIFLSALLAFVIMTVWRRKRAVSRVFGLLVVSVGVSYAAFQGLTGLVGESFLMGRFDWFQEVSLDAVEGDASGQARLYAYDIMWREFQGSPMLGNGLGHLYQSVTTGAIAAKDTFTLDTPFVYLAKFGVIGTIILLCSLAAIVKTSATLAPKGSNARAQAFLMCGATAAAWLATLPSGAPTEQKGFGIGLAMLIAMSIAWAREEADGAPQIDTPPAIPQSTSRPFAPRR